MSTETFHEGDLVEAVKGETVIRGRAVPHVAGGFAPGECMAAITWYQANGFTVTVIEKAAPKLRFEPGAYKFAGWQSTAVLNESGEWYDDYGNKLHFGPEDSSRLTRLEPVSVTAKRVLERLANFWEFGPPQWMAAEIKNIAIEFGVSE